MTMPALKELYEVFAGTECAEPNEEFYITHNVPYYSVHKEQYDKNQAAIKYVKDNDVISIYHDTEGEKSVTDISQSITQAVTDGYTIHTHDANNESSVIGVK